MKKVLCALIVTCLIGTTFPALAISTDNFGLSVPNIQSVQVSEQSGPKSGGELVMESPVDENSYLLGPGDQLAIHLIIGNADLAVDHYLLIGADGKVFFPNIGELYLSGLSLAAAKKTIDSKIRETFHKQYKLSVLLSQPKKVKIYLAGMVKNPGPLAVYDNIRVSEVLAQSGGVASGASNRFVYIKRIDKGTEQKLVADLFTAYRNRDLDKDIRIRAGDVIEVPDSNNDLISTNNDKHNDKLLFEGKETFVYVYGEVAKSGRFEFVPGKKLSDYISYAGGPTQRALLGSTTVTRLVDGRAEKLSVDAGDVIYNGHGEKDLEVIGGDVINVPANFFYFSDFASFSSMIFTGVALYNTIRR